MQPLDGLDDEFVELNVNRMMENLGIGFYSIFNEWAQRWDCTSSLVCNCRDEAIDIITLSCGLPEKEGRQKPSIPGAYLSETMCDR